MDLMISCIKSDWFWETLETEKGEEVVPWFVPRLPWLNENRLLRIKNEEKQKNRDVQPWSVEGSWIQDWDLDGIAKKAMQESPTTDGKKIATEKKKMLLKLTLLSKDGSSAKWWYTWSSGDAAFWELPMMDFQESRRFR